MGNNGVEEQNAAVFAMIGKYYLNTSLGESPELNNLPVKFVLTKDME